MNSKKNTRYVFLPEGISSKKVLICFITAALELDVHDANWNAFEEGINCLDLKSYSGIVLDHEKLPVLNDEDIKIYFEILTKNPSIYLIIRDLSDYEKVIKIVSEEHWNRITREA